LNHEASRRLIVATGLRMNAAGINQGTSGNLSVRVPEGFLVTPSGVPYDELAAEHVVEVGLDGHVAPGQLVPSSEWAIHRDVYVRRPEVGAVLHAHAMFATSLSCLRRGIPAFHYMVAVAGGRDIRCADYATFGTPELSAHVLAALEGRKACLMANHGMLAIAETLPKALKLAIEVETLAAQYWRALQVGAPVLLPDEEMDRVLEKFATYGKQPSR
jgi:L-fuculose-phosphate aldolase